MQFDKIGIERKELMDRKGEAEKETTMSFETLSYLVIASKNTCLSGVQIKQRIQAQITAA